MRVTDQRRLKPMTRFISMFTWALYTHHSQQVAIIKTASMNVHVYTHVVHFSAKSDIYKANHIYHKIYNRAFVNIFYFLLNYFLMIMILVYDILWLNCNHLPPYQYCIRILQ